MMDGDSTQRRRPSGSETPAPAAPPTPWRNVLLVYGLGVTCGLAALILAAYYLHTRPLDLVGPSNQIHSELEFQLAAYGVAPETVARVSEERRADEQAYWNHAVYEAEALTELDGLRDHLIHELTLRNVAVYEEAGEIPGETVLSLGYAGREVAEVRLRGAAPPGPDPAPVSPCLDLADAAAEALGDAEIPMRLTGRHDPPSELLAEMDCAAHILEGVLDEVVDTALLLEYVEESLAPLGARVYGVSHGHPLIITIIAARDDCECLRIELEPSGELREALDSEDAPPLEPPDVDEVPLDSEHHPEPAPEPEPEARDPDAPVYAGIIIDDGGYGGPRTEAILALDVPLTIAILPYTPDARSLAERAVERGFEVILHMPMEANNDNVTYPNEIRVGMDAGEIATLVEKAFAETPGAVGVNNHTGSRFTADAEAMRHFFSAIEESGYYFVDSMTTPDSVAYSLAREFEIPAARRNVFLDHDHDPEKIREAFEHFIDQCKRHGRAIAIGHFQSPIADIFDELLERLEEEEITLLPVSELVR